MKRAPAWLLVLGLLLGSAGFVGLGVWAFTSSLEVPAVSVVDGAESSVRAWIDGPLSADGGVLVVQTVAPAAVTVETPEVEVDGLSFERQGTPRVETVGQRQVITERYVFRGAAGMYEIGPLSAYWNDVHDEPQRADGEPFWLDLGVDPPRQDEIVDIAEPEAVGRAPWVLVAGVLGLLGLLGGGVWVAFRAVPSRDEQELVVPPHVLALREWARVRADDALDEYATAVELSRIFREYAELVLGFPATAWTTRQTLDHLAGLTHLPEGNVPRAKRLLRATDLVKYAEHDPDSDFFEDLDADLRAFVDATRPAGGAS